MNWKQNSPYAKLFDKEIWLARVTSCCCVWVLQQMKRVSCEGKDNSDKKDLCGQIIYPKTDWTCFPVLAKKHSSWTMGLKITGKKLSRRISVNFKLGLTNREITLMFGYVTAKMSISWWNYHVTRRWKKRFGEVSLSHYCWSDVTTEYPSSASRTVKTNLPFSTTFHCEKAFSAPTRVEAEKEVEHWSINCLLSPQALKLGSRVKHMPIYLSVSVTSTNNGSGEKHLILWAILF